MAEQVPMGMSITVEKFSRPSLVSKESFELLTYPVDKILIDVIPNTTKC